MYTYWSVWLRSRFPTRVPRRTVSPTKMETKNSWTHNVKEWTGCADVSYGKIENKERYSSSYNPFHLVLVIICSTAFCLVYCQLYLYRCPSMARCQTVSCTSRHIYTDVPPCRNDAKLSRVLPVISIEMSHHGTLPNCFVQSFINRCPSMPSCLVNCQSFLYRWPCMKWCQTVKHLLSWSPLGLHVRQAWEPNV